MTWFVGIDIGSTAAKAIVLDDRREIRHRLLLPTGWSSAETAKTIEAVLTASGFSLTDAKCVATGYGRISVPFADKAVTEITCHAKGVLHLFQKDCIIIDIGGQDTKVISLRNGSVSDFIMNDKCSAGTGRFLEVMANSLGISLDELFTLAETGSGVTISSLCTVFAQSELVSLIGGGCPKQDIAYGICESIISKVISLCSKQPSGSVYYLSGGLCESDYLKRRLSARLKAEVHSAPEARYAGALGAALLAQSV